MSCGCWQQQPHAHTLRSLLKLGPERAHACCAAGFILGLIALLHSYPTCAAARVQQGMRPNGAHRWHSYVKTPK